MAMQLGGAPPECKQIYESFTCNTDIDTWTDVKKSKLFEYAGKEFAVAKGAPTKEMKKIVEHMAVNYKKLLAKHIQLNKEIAELKRAPTPAARPQPPNQQQLSYANAVRNKKTEYVVLVKKAAGAEEESDVRAELFKSLKPVEKEVDILKTSKRHDTLVVQVRNEEQQKTVINRLKNSTSVDCNLPAKRIPAVRISEIDKSMQADDILQELEEKEGINKKHAKVKIILNNTNYRTNRAIIAFNEEDTKRLLIKGEVKMGLKIHPIEPDFGVVQCKNCNKFGHFHKSKDKTKVQCKDQDPTCVHCGGNHDLKDCRVKSERSKAKCSNCSANHRAYDVRCPRRSQVIEKLKDKFICLH